MNEQRISYLFKVYFNMRATATERAELMELLLQSEHDEQLRALLTATWETFFSKRKLFNEAEGEEMLSRIMSKAAAPPTRKVMGKMRPVNLLTIMAALFIPAIVVTYFLLPGNPPATQIVRPLKGPTSTSDSIVPGSDKAVLTLSDGSNIKLDSSHTGTLAMQGNAKVVNLQSARLTYSASDGDKEKVAFNTLSTFNGGQYQLQLSDGTKVWLNASSSIRYPVSFKGSDRTVTVTGEAYFEVAKNPSMPFKISVRDIEVEVLGTHFDIMAYQDESSVNTTLLEGSVKINKGSKNTMLTPGQEARVLPTGDINITEADVEEVMAWKNGWFQFNGYDIKKVMRQISRWYNVEIVYQGTIPGGHFTGLVSRGNNITQVLKIMQAGGVSFKIEGRSVIVYSGK